MLDVLSTFQPKKSEFRPPREFVRLIRLSIETRHPFIEQ